MENAKTIVVGGTIVGLGGCKLVAVSVNDGIVTWNTGMSETLQDVASNASTYGWTHEDGSQISTSDPVSYEFAMFASDHDVREFCSRVSECEVRKINEDGSVTIDVSYGKLRAAIATAWDRDENGWRSRAEARAKLFRVEMSG